MTDASLTMKERTRLARLRLTAQLVAARPSAAISRPADVVRRMLAMQAQDFPASVWAVALRLPGGTAAHVLQALTDGSIVRSWPMRGTLHLTAPEDLGWIQSLTTERLLRSASTTHAAAGLGPREFAVARDAVLGALTGNRMLTRPEMYELFRSVGIAPEEQRGYHLLWHLAQTGVICLGPPLQGAGNQAQRQSFVLASEWIRAPRLLEREEALAELARRYFTGHGPATVRDLAWWAGLTLADARLGVEQVGGELATLTIGGSDYLLSPELLDAGPAAAASGVFALAGFDEFVLGYQDRSAQLAAEHVQRIVPGKNGMFLSTIVTGGLIAGTWRRTIARSGVAVTAEPFGSLSATVSARFDREARRYARHLGLPLIAAAAPEPA
ncbi:winged helix DNA-binding protein [Homoserinimonas aerilata]|uniref:Winged helix DNA-binding protein n=1 Tax=Homoserinimonas aerilata TaxID=1162970 RepID=A0A542YIH1_9MICO|nr:winged helix DNA-binding domain-containing protein [Homoserinimonas aerilata]TQL47811.1 winged helix DNA-binding protein [Homoserinimonas aerilata]